MFFTYTLVTILFGVAAAITTIQSLLTVIFRRRKRFFAPGPRVRSGSAGVSILKPVCGLDDELEANLESFAALRGIDYEVIVSIADQSDPALPVVQRVMRRHRDVRWKGVTGGDAWLENGNRKIARLIAAMRYAQGDIIFISDSNVRVGPDDIARTIAAFDDPRVGCVSNLFVAQGAETLGAAIESLHLLSFVAPGAVTAAASNVPCVVGKSMAIRREVLDAIGGFEAFARVLAEDQAIGLAVRNAGYEVRLSPVVVHNVVVRRTVQRAVDRQMRWNKIRYAFSRPTYAAEFLLFPLPYALIAALLHPAAFVLPLCALALRIVQVASLARATGASLPLRAWFAIPLFDLLHFGAQFAPYIDDRVTWRGYSTRLGPNTLLIDIAA